MLKGFEEYTGPLNDYERTTVMPRVASILAFCVGPEKAATNKDLRENLLATYNLKVSDPRVRAIINEIRTSDVVPYLVASSKGYYIATSVEEVEDYARTPDSRIREMTRVRDALLSQVEGKLFLNQK
jgi:hypothetical protein